MSHSPAGWADAPEPVVLRWMSWLDAHDVLAAGSTCRSWHRLATDQLLWRHLLTRDFHLGHTPHSPPIGSGGWLEEYKRLSRDIPIILTQCIDAHSNQVLHVSFAHNGTMFATTSKDGTVMVWNSSYPCTLKYQHDMKEFSWKYTQFTQFNSSDTLLLVSGVHFGSNLSTSGEIAVFTLQNEFLLQCRVVNKPYDIFGCWISESHLLSGELHWLGHLTSATFLWINKASQEPESEHTPILSQLYRFYNPNASTVRSLLVGDCKWNNDDINKEDVIHLPNEDIFRPRTNSQMTIFYDKEYTSPAIVNESEEEGSSETDSGSWSGSSQDEDLKNKLLIFTIGADTYTPHRIGFKKIDKIEFPRRLSPGPSIKERIAARKRELARERERQEGDHPNWEDFEAVKDMFDVPDKVIDMRGHIIGMALSPDNKYLYVNSRPWPPDYIINNPLAPPPLASHIDIHVIDLTKLTIVGRMLRAQQDYTSHSGCFFIFLDVSDKYVASGAEGAAYIWDRHYGICLTLLPHSDCVNAIAFNPTNPHMCVTVCDDYSIRVWHSRSYTKRLRIGGRGQTEGIAFHTLRN
ncbi:F-box and WD repeat domain containing 5 [Arctopsyche grandis]|uniref:F-box and WD repeat domain containing 5 n=1 Tax=Arctopsyche grandis TaxID=121162 RepID=UPI00406D6B14